MATLNGNVDDNVELWRHPRPETTELYKFQQHVAKRYSVQLPSYHALFQWSIENPGSFWQEVWDYTGIKATKPPSSTVDKTAAMFPKPEFFAGCDLNFAENLLYPASDPAGDSLAIIAASEKHRENITWDDLRERVRLCAAGMEAAGISTGDRVAGYLAHHAQTVVAMLAATSLGALWTGVSPDTGVQAVLDRLAQVEPVLLFADNAVQYNGKTHETLAKVSEVVSKLPSLKNVVIFENVKGHAFNLDNIASPSGAKIQMSSDFVASGSSRELSFKSLPPDHPVYILYSSGTTGTPKGIVHGALGTLLQHKKEHQLQSDIRPGERLFYFTTCTWMMWHWLISGLASGATLVLYDGSPFQPHKEMSMPLLIDELQINHFGTSAKYLSVLEQAGTQPRTASPKPATLSSLKSIFSTGSPLAPSTFEYVYTHLSPPAPHQGIMLSSITGGTDIVSLFGGPCPLIPVYKGEIQGPGLGMAIACYDASGKDISSTGEPGELVCTVPFPCQPVMFWPPGKQGAQRYQSSYFETFSNSRDQPIWHHGDFIRFNPKTGGIHMLGRSDGVLNPSGVRFGSSEIYNVILAHFSTQVEDALCIGRKRASDPDEAVVLFVKMAAGQDFSEELRKGIQAAVRKELSARHVPAVIDPCPEIPYTMNGKKVEGAVKQILCGLNIKTSASVANSGCLDWYRTWAEEH